MSHAQQQFMLLIVSNVKLDLKYSSSAPVHQVRFFSFLTLPLLTKCIGLMLCQILRQSGAALVVLAANKGKKMDIAKENGYADEFIEFDRNDAEAGWNLIKEKYPYGFDGVVRLLFSRRCTFFC